MYIILEINKYRKRYSISKEKNILKSCLQTFVKLAEYDKHN